MRNNRRYQYEDLEGARVDCHSHHSNHRSLHLVQPASVACLADGVIMKIIKSMLYIAAVIVGFAINFWCGVGVLLIAAGITLLTDKVDTW